MTFYTCDFPFEETARYDNYQEAVNAGHAENCIWSVCDGSEDDDNCLTYGPPHHYVNRLFVVVTKETHDGDTYYEEHWD